MEPLLDIWRWLDTTGWLAIALLTAGLVILLGVLAVQLLRADDTDPAAWEAVRDAARQAPPRPQPPTTDPELLALDSAWGGIVDDLTTSGQQWPSWPDKAGPR